MAPYNGDSCQDSFFLNFCIAQVPYKDRSSTESRIDIQCNVPHNNLIYIYNIYIIACN